MEGRVYEVMKTHVAAGPAGQQVFLACRECLSWGVVMLMSFHYELVNFLIL